MQYKPTDPAVLPTDAELYAAVVAGEDVFCVGEKNPAVPFSEVVPLYKKAFEKAKKDGKLPTAFKSPEEKKVDAERSALDAERAKLEADKVAFAALVLEAEGKSKGGK